MKKLFVIILLFFPFVALSQVEADVEQWIEENGDSEAAADLNDRLIEWREHPINLNDTLSIRHFSLLSPFQKQALTNYLRLYGPMLSHDELQFIPGFDSLTISYLSNYTITAPLPAPRPLRLSEGRHRLVTAFGAASTPCDSATLMQRARALLVYTYRLHDRIELRLVAEKDASETWGKGNFTSYHLLLNNIGRIERAIIGRYNLQYGQGLTLWTGLRPFTFMGSTPLRYGNGLRPSATLYEEDYQEGGAARLRLSNHWATEVFFSHSNGEKLTGTHIDFRSTHLLLGFTASHIHLDSLRSVRNYTYNQLAFRGQQQTNVGIDATLHYGRLTFFGEASLGENLKPAAVGGLQFFPSDGVRLGFTGRYYHPQYHNLHSKPFAISSGQGEQGLTLDVAARLPYGVQGLASIDVHNFPTLRYTTYQPTTGEWLRVQLCREWHKGITLTLRYANRLKERNIPNLDSTLYLCEQTLRQQLQGEVRYGHGSWQWMGRIAYVGFAPEQSATQHGFLMGAQARYSHSSWLCTASIAYFSTDDYYSRIYFSESTLQYAWSIPALYGHGLRGNLVLQHSIGQHLTLAARYCLTLKAHNPNHYAMLQMRLNL